MWFGRKPVLFLAVMVFALVPAGQGQENDSRRSVTEHQLMHDRGRTIQSLRRLIWLSSAMEGLHPAPPRPAPPRPLKAGLVGGPPSAGVKGQYRAARDNLIRDFFDPPLTPLPERDP